ncbi:VapE domain-containing protein [Clostridium perfringens]|uniref:VapE domain-containing protein n=1 Tax=Clostridium perfringens TaxID=1502 RepID=UPI0013E37717|nr:VapE domain-containing protein [Clostridium perfringens]MDZ4983314.1 hypothetical protein [Clostridium perfringens]NGT04449.1 hypothetical protein [Clostridium perfringens]
MKKNDNVIFIEPTNDEDKKHLKILNQLNKKLTIMCQTGFTKTDLSYYLKGMLYDNKISNDEFMVFKNKIENDAYKDNGINFPDVKVTKNGVKLLKTENNVSALLNAMSIDVKYNIITRKINIKDNKTESENLNEYDIAITRIYDMAQKQEFQISKDDIASYTTSISRRNTIDEFYDIIKDVKWDGKDYLDQLFKTITIKEDAQENKSFYKLLLTKWLFQIVASSELDRFNAAGVLVLYGNQFAGKTTFFKYLMPKEVRHLFAEGMTLNPESTDSVAQNTSFKLVEWGELEATQKYDQEELKKFITREVDTYRNPYARAAIDHKRVTVYGASCNSKEFLKDPTGSRRYWVIPVKKISDDIMKLDIKQLWAQILDMYHKAQANPPKEFAIFGNEYRSYFLTPQEVEHLQELNQTYTRKTVIDSYLSVRFDFTSKEQYYMTIEQIFMVMEGVANINLSNLGTTLKKMNIKNKRKSINGKRIKVYSMPKPVGKLGDSRDFVKELNLQKIIDEKDVSEILDKIGNIKESWDV